MADTAAVEAAPPAAPAAQSKAVKKKKTVSQPKIAGPKLSERILKVVAACSDRKGISLVAIKKGLAGAGYDVEKHLSQIRLAIRRNVGNGSLVQGKGKGASGSFKVAKKETRGKVAKKVKNPATKKPAAKKSPVKKLTKKNSVKNLTRKAVKVATGQKKAPAQTKAPKKTKAATVKSVSGARTAKGNRQPKTPKPKKAAKSPKKS